MRTIIGLAALARSGKDTVASMLLSHPGVAAFALADPLKVGCQALFGLTDEEVWSDDQKEKTIDLWGRSPREFFQTVGTEWMRHHNPEHWLMRADREINPPKRAPSPPNPPYPADLSAPDAPFALAAQAFFDFTDDQIWNPANRHIKDGSWGMSPQEAIELLKRHAQSMYPDYNARRATRPTTPLRPRGRIPHDATTVIFKDIRFENEAAFLRAHHGEIWHIVRPDSPKVNAHSSEHGVIQASSDIILVNSGTLSDLRNLVDKAWEKHKSKISSTKEGDAV
ncbi:deoxynucleotide monophosphate kinase [Pseudomonas aeruginosa]|uniref:deoxynucleotide monophosphate kinase family protein n=1 Tax=Pseudomonas aeruginosa TaxID=287 RepID=UPI001F2CDF34|nr:deoxynucleotide monophosphate kinase [Pseudomonas aeruginosa]MCS7966444.1 deoxynucleotide monophosphate kinase [Pseudomonas aeruginosa]MCS8135624.1 deoxynucleotide monophosphate kinase [Pseudomonas aeruginosa]MCS8178236.1 deoxynucleotide monophosphate kinase [Pseudomonas aeruginosa]MCS8189757.1 deoxynucleotide monophosphate kinase [Pseudomonas aeruginosa]MCT0918547.1 deoxynucleotide monophosphate kinase [Pseudomonas aeruginosa]